MRACVHTRTRYPRKTLSGPITGHKFQKSTTRNTQACCKVNPNQAQLTGEPRVRPTTDPVTDPLARRAAAGEPAPRTGPRALPECAAGPQACLKTRSTDEGGKFVNTEAASHLSTCPKGCFGEFPKSSLLVWKRQ